MSWGSLNYGSATSSKLIEQDILLEPTSIFEPRQAVKEASQTLPEEKLTTEKYVKVPSENLQDSESNKEEDDDNTQEVPEKIDGAQAEDGKDEEQPESQDLSPESRQASVKTLLKAQETTASSISSLTGSSVEDIDPLSVGSTSSRSIAQKPIQKSPSAKFLKKHTSGGTTTTSSVKSFMKHLDDWDNRPVMSISIKSVNKKARETQKPKVEVKDEQTAVVQDETKKEIKTATKVKSATDSSDITTETRRASSASKMFFEKLKSQLDAIKEDADAEEAEQKRKSSILSVP